MVEEVTGVYRKHCTIRGSTYKIIAEKEIAPSSSNQHVMFLVLLYKISIMSSARHEHGCTEL